MRVQRIETQQITGHQELADLAAAVFHQLDQPDTAAQDSVAGPCHNPLTMNFLLTLDGHRGAELFQEIERIARTRRPK